MKEERLFEPTMFKSYLRSKMISLLQSIAGRKLLMLEPAVYSPINLIIENKAFAEHGVPEEDGIIGFQAAPIEKNHDQILIFLSPTWQNLTIAKELITINLERGDKKYYFCFWPKCTLICRQFFQQEELSKYVQIRQFNFDLLPIDIDLYSLEMKTIKDLFVNHDESIYTTVADSIHRLQCVFGKIPNYYGKGKGAKAVYEILKIRESQIKIDDVAGEIESIIVFERSIDFITPLLKQITYQGLIDEFYGISGSIVKIPSASFDEANKGKNNAAKKTFMLNSQKDHIYQQIRYLPIYGARKVLKAKAAESDQYAESYKTLTNIIQIATATKKIKSQKDLINKHLQIAFVLMEQMKNIGFHKDLILQQRCLDNNQIIQYLEVLIAFALPLQKLLRLMCLQSIINKGIHKKIFSRICEDICCTYGLQMIQKLSYLSQIGLFFEQKSINNPYLFNEIRKQLKLASDSPIIDDNPQDTSFAYNGYVPIAARLVEEALRSGWKQLGKAMKLIPGETVVSQKSKQGSVASKSAVIVYFIGGVTYGQVATIRLLSKMFKREIVVATTEIINGDSFLAQIIR